MSDKELTWEKEFDDLVPDSFKYKGVRKRSLKTWLHNLLDEHYDEGEVVGQQRVAEDVISWVAQTSGISESSRYLLEVVVERLKQYIP